MSAMAENVLKMPPVDSWYDEVEKEEEKKSGAADERAPMPRLRPRPRPQRMTCQECRICHVCFVEHSELVQHLRARHPRLIKCHKCDLHVVYGDLTKHLKDKHPLPKGCLACKKCGDHVLKGAIKKHIATVCSMARGTCRYCDHKDRRDKVREHVKICSSNPKNKSIAGGAGGAGGATNKFKALDDDHDDE
jgi:hypothetical protein